MSETEKANEDMWLQEFNRKEKFKQDAHIQKANEC